MAASFYEPLTALDSWFLYGERAEAPLHIGGVYTFEGASQVPGGRGAQGVGEILEERLHLLPRYRQKVRHLPFDLGHPVWVDDPDFDLSYHVRRAALPRPGDEATLREYAARVYARPLDLSKPLWELTVVEGLTGGRVALIFKVHHAMVDGISTLDLATILFDVEPKDERGPVVPWQARQAPSDLAILRDTFGSTGPIEHLKTLGHARLSGAQALLSGPWSGAVSLAMSFVRPRTRLFFNRPIGPHRRLQSFPVPLTVFKDLRRAFGCTVNDAVLAVVGEGLRSWLIRRGEEVPQSLRVFCPVSVRDQSARYRLGNQVSGMVVEIPLGRLKPLDRLARISAITGDLKRSRQAVAAQNLVHLADWAPATLHALSARLLPEEPQWVVNMIVTNVPGPQVPFYLGGAQMVDVWPFVPVYHSLGLNIALTSYCGNIHFGLQSDRDVVPDLDLFAEALQDAATTYHGLVAAQPVRPSTPPPAGGRGSGRPRDSRPGQHGSRSPRASAGRGARRPSS